MLTMILGGLWHGAAWTFVLWGAYQGAAAHRLSRGRSRPALHAWSRRTALVARDRGLVMFHLTCLRLADLPRPLVAASSGHVAAACSPAFAARRRRRAGMLVPLLLYTTPLLLVHAHRGVRRRPAGRAEAVAGMRYSVYAATFYLIDAVRQLRRGGIHLLPVLMPPGCAAQARPLLFRMMLLTQCLEFASSPGCRGR